MAGLKLLSHAIPRVAGKAFARKHVSLGRLFTSWPEVVGQEMAERCQPLKLKYHKRDQKLRATLTIAIASADAPIITLQKGVILERLNRVFSENWITDIHFEHVLDPQGAAFEKPPTPLTNTEKTALSDMLKNVEDQEMYEKLQNLGSSLLKEKP